MEIEIIERRTATARHWWNPETGLYRAELTLPPDAERSCILSSMGWLDASDEPEQVWDSSDRAVEGYKPLYRIDYEEPKDH